MNLCGSCATSFNIFKRKNRCTACQSIYCTNCFKKGQFLPQRNLKHCMKCHAFNSNPYIPSELMLLSIKELKNFIEVNNVPAIGCKEKQDLVDLIINHKVQHNNTVTENMNNTPASQGGTSSGQNTLPSNVVNFVQSMTQDIDLDGNSNIGGDFFNSLLVSSDGTGHTYQTQQGFNMGQPTRFTPQARPVWTTMGHHITTNQTTVHPPTSNPSGTSQTSTTTSNQASTSASSSNKTYDLKDFQSEDEIRCLSVKELKSMLDKNCVNYKGCTEKSELVQKVILLWQSTKSNHNGSKNGGEDSDGDLCKICMDSVADCVLLECGHLVACIECGKKLKECPICRQNILRILRVFKS